MDTIFINCFLETYQPHGLDIYVDEVHHPQMLRQYRHRMTDWRECVLLFLSLSSFRHTHDAVVTDQPPSITQLAKDAVMNVIGYEEHSAIWWKALNMLLIGVSILHAIAVIPFNILVNTIKLFTEFFPRVATVFLLEAANQLEHKPASPITAGLQYIGAWCLRLVAATLSSLRFISRAITSPMEGVIKGWRIGNALGGSQLGADREGRYETIYTLPGMLAGGILATLSALVTINVIILILPLVMLYYRVSPPQWVEDLIPDFVIKIMSLLDPLLDLLWQALNSIFGGNNINQFFGLNAADPIICRELCILTLLKHVTHHFHSPHARSELKEIAGSIYHRMIDAFQFCSDKVISQLNSGLSKLNTQLTQNRMTKVLGGETDDQPPATDVSQRKDKRCPCLFFNDSSKENTPIPAAPILPTSHFGCKPIR